MHRIPLKLMTPSICWNINDPEDVLFERTLNKINVEETTNFLTIIDEETDSYMKRSYALSMHQLTNVEELLVGKDCDGLAEGLQLLSNIILRAPKDSPALIAALKFRGSWYFQGCCFEAAANDFLVLLYIKPTLGYSELCEVHGNLAICFYLMRDYGLSRKHVRIYKKLKGRLQRNNLYNPSLEKIDIHISQFADELDDIETNAPKMNKSIFLYKQFKDSNSSKTIPFSTGACNYISNNKLPGMYAKRRIPKGSVVLVEHPVLQSINMPLVQCELCFHYCDQIYTCFECRYKTYCSFKCIEKDKAQHEHECVGLKYLILLVLDARDLYSMFLRVSELLNERVFNQKTFRKITSAGMILKKIRKIIDEKETLSVLQYLKLLTIKPNYEKLSSMQYATLVTTAFRLTIFIERKTFLIETFFKKLSISNKQKMIVVGAILMRLHCHILNNTFDFEYNSRLHALKQKFENVGEEIAEMAVKVRPVCRERDEIVGVDIKNYYKISKDEVEKKYEYFSGIQKEEARSFSLNYKHTHPCSAIQRPIATYKDNIAEMYFKSESNFDSFLIEDKAEVMTTTSSAYLICDHIAKMTDIERYMFVKKFARLFHQHFCNYFLQLSIRHNKLHQILSLFCPALGKFRHSCAPNVEVVVLENEVIMGKSLCDIAENEEMTVSFKAHFIHHTREDRKTFLQVLNIECYCKYCKMSTFEEPINLRHGVYCEHCEGMIITPASRKCPQCNMNYDNLAMKYYSKLRLVDEVLNQKLQPKANDRELFILHRVSCLIAEKFFVASHEYRISAELKYARFLALKNFAEQSYQVIMTVKKNISQFYEEAFIWFSFYSDILMTIKIILYYNLDEQFYSMRKSYLEELCTFGLHIVNGQKEHITLYETFDYESAIVLDNLKLFLKWKEKILCNAMLKKVHKTTRKYRCGSVETIPSLSNSQ